MKIEYIGDLPLVSQHGVAFDHTQPDKYLYLHPVLDLLEALDYDPKEATQHLYKKQGKELNGEALLQGLRNYVQDLDSLYAQREHKAKLFVDDLIDRVEHNQLISDEEKEAWLKNIDTMKSYFLQYVTNKTVYEASLKALANEITNNQVQQITVPMFRNYGIVLRDVQKILEEQKTPIDSTIDVYSIHNGVEGTITFRHPQNLSI